MYGCTVCVSQIVLSAKYTKSDKFKTIAKFSKTAIPDLPRNAKIFQTANAVKNTKSAIILCKNCQKC